MSVVAKAGFRVLERAEQHLHHPLRRTGRRLGLRHLDLVPAVVLVSAAERIRQRAHQPEGGALAIRAERRIAVTVELRVRRHRRPVEDVGDVALDVGALLLADHALEDVEPVVDVGLDNLGQQSAVRTEPCRAPVVELKRPPGPLLPISGHHELFGAEVDLAYVRGGEVYAAYHDGIPNGDTVSNNSQRNGPIERSISSIKSEPSSRN